MFARTQAVNWGRSVTGGSVADSAKVPLADNRLKTGGKFLLFFFSAQIDRAQSLALNPETFKLAFHHLDIRQWIIRPEPCQPHGFMGQTVERLGNTRLCFLAALLGGCQSLLGASAALA